MMLRRVGEGLAARVGGLRELSVQLSAQALQKVAHVARRVEEYVALPNFTDSIACITVHGACRLLTGSLRGDRVIALLANAAPVALNTITSHLASPDWLPLLRAMNTGALLNLPSIVLSDLQCIWALNGTAMIYFIVRGSGGARDALVCGGLISAVGLVAGR